ncbi:uncharacterized protein LOC115875319 [Sitophilus oryzae]|uniref:Uncharacterized protein LOC115875319 n=1 Tax=Sitophilus oryzae TaxID=7048 RepID=A0A6J2X6S9_SITOR|nr:uncharacterized protein LOC115875319 [Sitophilus oryzae]
MWESWRAALDLNKDDIFKYSHVCHLHFKEDSFDNEKSPFSLHLKKTAIPILITSNTSCRAASECDLSRKTTDSFCSEHANTIQSVSVMDCSSLPSTSTGVFKDNLELPYRPSSSTEPLENMTSPLSSIAKGYCGKSGYKCNLN